MNKVLECILSFLLLVVVYPRVCELMDRYFEKMYWLEQARRRRDAARE